MQPNQVKSIVNAPRWLILTTSLLLVSSLSGCASFDFLGKREKPIEITTKAADKTPLDIADPDPLKLKPVEWVLVTPSNQEEVFKKLEEKGADPVIFALTADGYQSLAVTIAELRNLINTQRNIIIKYKEYYEPKKEESKPQEKK
jgi:hypothetical protein